MYPQKIIKVEKIGIRPTVDIEVSSKDHIFYGNGIATSNSHAVSYAMNAYLSAYAKAHFPRIFFSSYLKFAKDKMKPHEEIKSLVQNASEMDIEIRTPDLRLLNKNFILKNDKIYFGLTDIKGFGDSVYSKLIKLISDNKLDLNSITWLDLLLKVLVKLNSAAIKSLVESGGLGFINKSRTSMIFEINICNELTDTEQGKILSSNIQFKDLNEAIQYLLDNQFITKRRLKAVVDLSNSLKFPAYSLIDGPEWISDVEDRALGCAITCSKLDLYDISMTNCSCRDFKNGNQKKVIIGGEIEYLNVTKTKTGKAKGSDMCFINLVDSTGSLDNVIFFPDQYKKYKNMLFTGNIIILFGNRSQSGDGLVVEKAYVAKT